MDRVSDETWYAVLLFFALIIVPFLVGLTIFKMYRKVFPLKSSENMSVVEELDAQRLGFFKPFMIGWCICGPVVYWFYDKFLSYL
ncbi:hypothetical protein A7985_09245 [Pseudoalteromonas luteoviolacea]|uniref:Uncharacterized protein n=1 Tax=Pseudoalteromonas luteoviolacea TaxID=43657 RepID=A0A1C0TS94_9GAMM|nr:hypothetical protein [Pseudoalteromonas luteoviolacea]MBQ4810620.1 hypothetical protein [Pseudoalteromonas luteoviolacea]OCQ21984.1 hypothetical protein A7985_09245 [Pseudoalteromonas luteoviolacea]